MSDKFDQLFEDARNSGEIPDAWLERFEAASSASGLRKDLKEATDKYRDLMTQNSTMRTGLLGDRFKSLGITISPQVLNIPEDLDPTDEDKVTTWAQEMGLVAKTETTSPAERAQHDRIAQASNEGGNVNTITSADLVNAASEDEFYAKVAAYEATRKR